MNGQEIQLEELENETRPSRIPVYFEEEGVSGKLFLLPIGHNLYQVEEAPAMTEVVNYKDIIETEPQSDAILVFRRVVEKSNYRYFEYLVSKKVTEAAPFQTLLASVTAQGGCWKIDFGGFVLIYLPPDSERDLDKEIASILSDYK